MTDKQYKVLEPWRKLERDELFKSPSKIWFKEGWTLKLNNSVSLNYVRHRDDHDNFKGEHIRTVYGIKTKKRKRPLALANMVRGGLIQLSSLIENFTPEIISYSAEYFADIAKDIEQFLPYYAEVPTRSRFFKKEIETLRLLCANRERFEKGFSDGLDKLLFSWDREEENAPITDFTFVLIKTYKYRLENLLYKSKEEYDIKRWRSLVEGGLFNVLPDYTPPFNTNELVEEYTNRLNSGVDPRELGLWYRVETLAERDYKS